MVPLSRLLVFPHPKTFLHALPLRTGTHFATLSLLLNKAATLYGLLALLSSPLLSPVQLSMYIYSFLALLILTYLYPGIRSRDPLRCLALAWVFILDTLVNAGYTTAFAITWFRILAGHSSAMGGIVGPGSGLMNGTAGFTEPAFNVSSVNVVTMGKGGFEEDAVALATVADAPAGANAMAGLPSAAAGFAQQESLSSALVVMALWMLRLYLMVVVMSFAREVLGRRVAFVKGWEPDGSGTDRGVFDGMEGWKGRVGRAMLKVGKRYWLNWEEEEVNGRYELLGERGPGKDAEISGDGERERRRRCGAPPAASA